MDRVGNRHEMVGSSPLILNPAAGGHNGQQKKRGEFRASLGQGAAPAKGGGGLQGDLGVFIFGPGSCFGPGQNPPTF